MNDEEILGIIDSFIHCQGPQAESYGRALESFLENPDFVNVLIRITSISHDLAIKNACLTLFNRKIPSLLVILPLEHIQQLLQNILILFKQESNFDVIIRIKTIINCLLKSNNSLIPTHYQIFEELYSNGQILQAVLIMSSLASRIDIDDKYQEIKEQFRIVSYQVFQLQLEKPRHMAFIIIKAFKTVKKVFLDNFFPLPLIKSVMNLGLKFVIENNNNINNNINIDIDGLLYPRILKKFWGFLIYSIKLYKKSDEEFYKTVIRNAILITKSPHCSNSNKAMVIREIMKIVNIVPESMPFLFSAEIRISMEEIEQLLSLGSLRCTFYNSSCKYLYRQLPPDKFYYQMKIPIVKILGLNTPQATVCSLCYLAFTIGKVPQVIPNDMDFVADLLLKAFESNCQPIVFAALRCVYSMSSIDDEKMGIFLSYIKTIEPKIKELIMCGVPEITRLACNVYLDYSIRSNSLSFEFFYMNRNEIIQFVPDFYYNLMSLYLLFTNEIPDEFCFNFLSESLPLLKVFRESDVNLYCLILNNVFVSLCINENLILVDDFWSLINENFVYIFNSINQLFADFETFNPLLCVLIKGLFNISRYLHFHEANQKIAPYFSTMIQIIRPLIDLFNGDTTDDTSSIKSNRSIITPVISKIMAQHIPPDEVASFAHTLITSPGENTEFIIKLLSKVVNIIADEDVFGLLDLFFTMFDFCNFKELELPSYLVFPENILIKCRPEIVTEIVEKIKCHIVQWINFKNQSNPFNKIIKENLYKFHDIIASLVLAKNFNDNVMWTNMYMMANPSIYFHAYYCLTMAVKYRTVPDEQLDAIARFAIQTADFDRSIFDIQNWVFLLNILVTSRNQIIINYLAENIENIPISSDEEFDKRNLNDNIASLYLNFATVSPNLVVEKLIASINRFIPTDNTEIENFIRSLIELANKNSPYFNELAVHIFIAMTKYLSLPMIKQKNSKNIELIGMLKLKYKELFAIDTINFTQIINQQIGKYPSFIIRIQNVLNS